MNGRLYVQSVGKLSNASLDKNSKTAIVINSGMAKHGIYYSEELLKNYADKFNNVPFYVNGHKPSGERTPEDIVGVFKNARYDENTKSVYADLVFFKHKEQEKLLVEELSNSDLDVGLSAVFTAEYEYRNSDSGDKYIFVNSIDEVESVDFVLHPATMARLLNSVKQKYDAKITVLNNTQEVETKPMENMNATNNLLISNEQDISFTPPTNPKQNGIIVNQDFLKSYNKLLINNRLAEYNVDDSVKELVLSELSNSVHLLTEETIDNCIKKHNDFFNKVKNRVIENAQYPAYVKEEETEKLINAIEGFFTQRPVNGVPPLQSIRKIWQLTTGDFDVTGEFQNCDKRRLAQFIQASNQLRNQNGKGLIANSVTLGDWAIAFGNLMYRQLLREYDAEYDLMVWRRIVRVVSANDFRPQVRTRIGGYPNLPIVQELQNYPTLRSPNEESIQYSVAKRGGTEEISWEAIVNDDVGEIRRIPQKLAFAAARTLFEFVMDFLFNNPTIYNGKNLFATDHPVNLPDGTTSTENNIVTYTAANGLSYKDVIRGRNRMRLFRDPSSGRPAGVIPKFLVGGVDFEELLYLITNNAAYPATRGASSTGSEPFPASGNRQGFTTDENYVKTFNLEYIIHPFTSNSTNVFMVADPNRFETMEIAFLGSEQPEMYVQDLPNVGTYFFADKVVYKIRHVYGGNILDFRSFLRFDSA
ncbi:MAG: Mu-like prophage major head subunit gpT family protein [Candidatus Calescibacterium sp.]|nr:Mu-like prophage major head subunit gpT family protein [Candidatus Calescibacterium sp.]